jgi:hypothetical protein
MVGKSCVLTESAEGVDIAGFSLVCFADVQKGFGDPHVPGAA